MGKGLQFASYWNNLGEKQWWLGSGDSSERLNQLRHIKSGSPGDSDSEESACNVGDLGSVPGSGRSPGEGIGYPLQCSWASLVAQLVKNPSAMWETWVQSLGWEDPLEKGKATHSNYSCLESSVDRGAWWATVHKVAKSRTRLSD